jgi:hypothetical protein
MRIFCLAVVLLFAACTRPPLPPPPGQDGGADAAPFDLSVIAAPDCTKAPDCYACCAGVYQSGALDFDSDTSGCACQNGSTCAGACNSTVCGDGVGANAACLACIDGLSVDGGACQATVYDCVTNDGPCGTWKTCAESCAGE